METRRFQDDDIEVFEILRDLRMLLLYFVTVRTPWPFIQESRAVARKPRDAAAVLFGLKFADNIHYNFKNSQLPSFESRQIVGKASSYQAD